MNVVVASTYCFSRLGISSDIMYDPWVPKKNPAKQHSSAMAAAMSSGKLWIRAMHSMSTMVSMVSRIPGSELVRFSNNTVSACATAKICIIQCFVCDSRIIRLFFCDV